MPETKHLKNAPISEAIFDFRVRLPSQYQVKNFLSLKEKLCGQYPKVQTRRMFKGAFQLKNEMVIPVPPEEKGIHGYFFSSEDGRSIAQFRRDGFTFNRLKPYTKWENILVEVKRLWNLYLEEASPESINRIAVRYINHLDIPLDENDLSSYLQVPPQAPKNAAQDIESFLSKIVIRDAETNLMANFTQALEKDPGKKYGTILLDIDIYKSEEFVTDYEKIWTTFEDIHKLKNQIFFNSITEKTMRLYL